MGRQRVGILLRAARGDDGLVKMQRSLDESIELSADVFDTFAGSVARFRHLIETDRWNCSEDDEQVIEQMMGSMRNLSLVRNRLLAIKRRGESMKEQRTV